MPTRASTSCSPRCSSTTCPTTPSTGRRPSWCASCVPAAGSWSPTSGGRRTRSCGLRCARRSNCSTASRPRPSTCAASCRTSSPARGYEASPGATAPGRRPAPTRPSPPLASVEPRTAIGKKAEQSEATRRKLLRVSRRLFATRGYAGTSIAEIVARAKVTRGALYHHFESKQDVFRGVYEDVQREMAERFYEAAIQEPNVGKRLEVGCEVFLDACLDRGLQRIVLVDSPSVLGWDYWHEIDEKYSLGHMRNALA